MPESVFNPPTSFRFSAFWDVYLPFSVTTIPAILFGLFGVVARGLDKAGVEAAPIVVCLMLAIQVVGMVAIAVVVLVRWDLGIRQLRLHTGGASVGWRKLVLLMSIASLLVCDVCTNLAAAFSGASFLLVGSVVTFVAYLILVRMAFAGLDNSSM